MQASFKRWFGLNFQHEQKKPHGFFGFLHLLFLTEDNPRKKTVHHHCLCSVVGGWRESFLWLGTPFRTWPASGINPYPGARVGNLQILPWVRKKRSFLSLLSPQTTYTHTKIHLDDQERYLPHTVGGKQWLFQSAPQVEQHLIWLTRVLFQMAAGMKTYLSNAHGL